MCEFREITPYNKLVFKSIFSSPGYERILIHFLNCAIKTETPIKKIELIVRKFPAKKTDEECPRLNLLAETENREKIDIEIQVSREVYTGSRSLFNRFENYISALNQGRFYSESKRIICINILSYDLFDDDKFLHTWRLYNRDQEKHGDGDLKIQFIELNKMNHIDAANPITFWIEFFKGPYLDLKTCLEICNLVPEIREAKMTFDRIIADTSTRKRILQIEDSLRNYNSAIISAVSSGIREGLAEARAKAEVGNVELKAQAKEDELEIQKLVKQRLLADGLPADLVAKYFGLTVEEIKSL